MSAILTLTSDFGLNDAYVAAMKGVILGINPEAKLVDICHTIAPQDIPEAAFVLGTACRFFPAGTVHLVVVDPGVGSERRAIILRTPSADFVAPDNGVLSYILEDAGSDGDVMHRRGPGPEPEAYAVSNPEFWRKPVSATFHGRDIFAPVAAHLSLGTPPERFGERVTSLTTIPVSRPQRLPDGSLIGHVRHIDRFGNLITDVSSRDLPPTGDPVTIEIGERVISGLRRTYAEAEGLLALLGGSDHLEVSLRDGSARDLLSADVGDEVRITPQAGGEP